MGASEIRLNPKTYLNQVTFQETLGELSQFKPSRKHNKTLKLIEDYLGKNLEHMGTGEDFMNRTPLAYALRSRIDKWDLIKLQRFSKANDTVNRTKWQPKDWERSSIILYPIEG